MVRQKMAAGICTYAPLSVLSLNVHVVHSVYAIHDTEAVQQSVLLLGGWHECQTSAVVTARVHTDRLQQNSMPIILTLLCIVSAQISTQHMSSQLDLCSLSGGLERLGALQQCQMQRM